MVWDGRGAASKYTRKSLVVHTILIEKSRIILISQPRAASGEEARRKHRPGQTQQKSPGLYQQVMQTICF